MADLFGGGGGLTRTEEQRRSDEADFTPVAVAVQLLLVLRRLMGPRLVRRALDPSAGAGCWGRAMRAVLGPDVYLYGVEKEPDEAPHLRAAYDGWQTSTLERAVAPGRFDLVATNPPFSSFARNWPAALFDAGWLADDALVAFYGLSQWGQSADAIPMLRAWPPHWQIRCAGRVAHREDGKADSREYSLWVWCVADRGERLYPSWTTVQVPDVLSTERRRWRLESVPGTCPIEPQLVEQIRRYL